VIANIEYLALAAAAGVFLLTVLAVGLVVVVRLFRTPSKPSGPGVFASVLTPAAPDEGKVFIDAVAALQKASAAAKVRDIFSNHVVNPHLQPFQNLAPTPAASEPPAPKS
jgi:hypothetical protein